MSSACESATRCSGNCERTPNGFFSKASKPLKETAEGCFEYFSENGVITFDKFRLLSRELFKGADNIPYDIADHELRFVFDSFDLNRDSRIDSNEFQVLWSDFVLKVYQPECVLIVIDVQNDFINGSLALRKCPAGQEALDVISPINELISRFKNVFYTLDWHPENHISFAVNATLYPFHDSSPVKQENAKVYDTVIFQGPPVSDQILWPIHCVQNSWGSDFHPNLKVADDSIIVRKGINPTSDSYSAFWDNQKKSKTELDEELRKRNVTHVFVCGLAYDYCVGYSALDSLDLGYSTFVVEDAIRGVSEDTINNMKERIKLNKGLLINSSNVEAIMNGSDRLFETGLVATLSFNKRSGK